jgi:hypothetical protein
MNRKTASLIILIFFLVLRIFAESADNTDSFDSMIEEFETIETENKDEEAKAEETNLEALITGTHSVRVPFTVLSGEEEFEGYLRTPGTVNALEIDVRFNDIRLKSEWEIETLLDQEAPLITGTTVYPLGNFITWQPGSFSITLGYQVFNWGTADTLNPTDNLNPKIYTKDIEPEKLPIFSVSAGYFPIDNLLIEAVYVPYPERSIYPTDPVTSIPPTLFTVDEITVYRIPFSLEAFVIGWRLVFFSPFVDLSVSYVCDYEDYYTPEITYNSPADKELELSYNRIHRIGADMKTTIGRFGLWLEVCANIPENIDIDARDRRKPSIAWTSGTDVFYGPDSAFYCNFQYNGTFIPNYDSSFYSDYPDGQPDPILMGTDPVYAEEYLNRLFMQSMANQNEGLLNGFILNLDFPVLDSKVTPGFAAAYYLPVFYDTDKSSRYGNLTLSPKIVFKPEDAFELAVGAQLMFAWHKMAGSDEITIDYTDPIGRRHDESNIYIMCSYTWSSSL